MTFQSPFLDIEFALRPSIPAVFLSHRCVTYIGIRHLEDVFYVVLIFLVSTHRPPVRLEACMNAGLYHIYQIVLDAGYGSSRQ